MTAGLTYWAIPDPNDPNVIQLATSYANASASPAVPVAIGSSAGGSDGGATLTFDPSVSIDAAEDTIDLGFDYANVPSAEQTLANGTALVYHGALGTFVEGLVRRRDVLRDPGFRQPPDHAPDQHERRRRRGRPTRPV